MCIRARTDAVAGEFCNNEVVPGINRYLKTEFEKENFTMSTEQNKAIARRFLEAFESNNQSAFNEVLLPDLVAHTHMGGPVNREAMLQGITAFHSAFSDVHVTQEDLIAEGDRVATRSTTRAIHTGNFQGAPPTGKQVAFRTMSVERIRDGKIVERWVNTDFMALMQQLGLIPPPQSAR